MAAGREGGDHLGHDQRPVERRQFIQAGVGITAVLAGLPVPPWSRRQGAIDTVFRDALVFDGLGNPPVSADVAVSGDRIADVGAHLLTGRAETIDLDGLALAPGFIDIHSHTDLDLFVSPLAESKIRQGVTTEVAGQDGSSIGPWSAEQAARVRERHRESSGVELDFSDLSGFVRQLEIQGTAVNLASMVGHGTVREFVIGTENRPASPEEIDRMRVLVAEALRAGACGLSSGLEYVPGAFATLDELVAVARPLSAAGLPYATHMRNEDDQLFAAIEEAVNVGRLAGVPVQISHLKAQGQRNWWKAEPVLQMLERARDDRVDVMYDRYPYVAYSTGLTSLFPVWARDGGTAGLLGRLAQPSVADRIERDVRGKITKLGNWDAVQITATSEDSLRWAAGRRLGTLAAEREVEPYRLLLELITGDRGRSGMVGFGMSEENTTRFLTHPLGMICSDGSALATQGPLARGTPHPRSFGTFPRVLGHYCRDERAMSLELAVRKMTALPAMRLKLSGRGVIAPGAFADLVAFDPDRIRDRATFEDPHQYPTGIVHVMVNGAWVLRGGERTPALPGRPLRPSAAR
jgi:N-acyl-D-amino-acid deacylase